MSNLLRDLRDIVRIIEWDMLKLKRQTVFVAMRTTWFIVQVLVFARAISYIVSKIAGVDYYRFYILGVFVSLLYSTSVSRGYVIADEFDDGVVEYHLSLPVKRSVLAVGRVLGGAISAVLFIVPMYLFILWVVEGFENPVAVAISLVSALVFSMGAVGFVLMIVLSVKSTDATDILLGTIDALLMRLSSVFYPLPVIAYTGIAPYYYASLVNPLTHMADFLRTLFLPEYIVYTVSPWAMVTYLVALGFGLLYVAIEFYVRKIEAGGWR